MNPDLERAERRALVTGGAGFVGSRLVDELIKGGFTVTVFDNMSTGTLANIGSHIGNKNFRLVRADVRDAKKIREETRRADVVFHLAAVVDVQRSIKDPSLVNQVNGLGTLNLLEACRAADIDLMVYASSCAIYGDRGRTKIREDAPLQPLSPYAASKLAGESYCTSFHRTYGLPIVPLRFFNIYGPRQSSGPYAGVIPKFVSRLLRNQPPIIFGDGKQSRDFVSVKDAVRAFLLPLRKRRSVGQAINIGSGRSTTINNLAQLLAKLTHRAHLKPNHKTALKGEIRHSLADISLAQKTLGYKPTVPLKSGLQEYIKWFRENQ